MAGKSAKASSSSSKAAGSRRKLVVFSALAGSLTVTALFLQLLSPPPVRAQAYSPVLMSDSTERASSNIAEPVGRPWKYIYIHQTKTSYADSQTASNELGDHFVIANGLGAGDGDLLVAHRWRGQQQATPPRGAALEPDGISIGLVGDFDRSRPSQAQIRRLNELVRSLRDKYAIPANCIYIKDHPSPAGIGRLFPAADFGKQARAE